MYGHSRINLLKRGKLLKEVNAFMRRAVLKQHQIGSMTVVIKRHKATKSLKLKIDPIHKIPILTVPLNCPPLTITAFLTQSEAWLIEQMTHFQSQLPGETIIFKGEPYRISRLIGDDAYFDLNIDHEAKLIYVAEGKQYASIRLKRLMCREALAYGQFQSEQFANQLNVSFNKVIVKDYRSRWGSCSSRRILTFSWRLIQAPPEIYNYVCAHEVAHLVHLNHSAEFWKVVASICPHYRESRHWLKVNGTKLFHYL
jgi:predicted metal-dependent hydrolase